MIRARKADVTAHLARHDIVFANDPSNLDRRFLRVRVRLELMVLLEDLSPGIVEHLTRLADELGGRALPEVIDESGRTIRLRGAHLRALRRAVELDRPLTVRISGGRELSFDPKASKRGPGGTQRPRTGEKGGAKTRKSG
jgi:tRNA(Ile)-lysidine synthase